MAELFRNPMSGSDWTTYELAAYSISVEYQDAATFFGMHTLPQPTVNPAVLTTPNPRDAADVHVCELLNLMYLTTSLAPEEESAVTNFVRVLLEDLGYSSRGNLLRTRRDTQEWACQNGCVPFLS